MHPVGQLDLTISNLDPSASYTFAATVHRNGGAGYASRITNWSLNGADSATYACSTGAQKVSETSAEFITGDNVDGLVARMDGHPCGCGRHLLDPDKSWDWRCGRWHHRSRRLSGLCRRDYSCSWQQPQNEPLVITSVGGMTMI